MIFCASTSLEKGGEWYRGQAVGGLGGGIWESMIASNRNEPYAAIHPLNSTGGWAQLKFQPVSRLEFNGAMGRDENFGSDLRFFATPYDEFGYYAMKQNRAEFVNAIYKPNSVLFLALEYRHLVTTPALGQNASGGHINLAAGARF